MLNCVAALSLREAARRSILPSPVPVPFPLLPPGRTRIIPKETLNEKKEKQKNRKKENTKARKPKKRDYSRSQSIQKSARFSFRVVWFVHAPVTHPTFQPPLTVSIIFLFISVFLLIFPLLIFFSFSFFFFANLRLRRQFADTRSLRCTHCFSPVHTHTVFLNYYVSFFPH